MAGDSSGNRRRMKIRGGPSGSRRARPQFILFHRHGSGSLSHPWGMGLELGEGSGRAGGEWEESASEIAHLQLIDFCCTWQPGSLGAAPLPSRPQQRWMTQIGIFSRGQLRGEKGAWAGVPATQPATRLHSPDLESSFSASGADGNVHGPAWWGPGLRWRWCRVGCDMTNHLLASRLACSPPVAHIPTLHACRNQTHLALFPKANRVLRVLGLVVGLITTCRPG